VKLLLIVFFLWEGRRSSWVCSTWSDSQWTVLLEVMKCLREAERRKRPEGWRNKTWMLHHNNTPAHTSLLIREFFGEARDCRPLTALLSRFCPCRLFFVAKFEIHSERSPISDNTRARKKICYRTCVLSHKTRSRTGKNVGSSVWTVEGSTLKETSLIML
jgi:hypothetical protein